MLVGLLVCLVGGLRAVSGGSRVIDCWLLPHRGGRRRDRLVHMLCLRKVVEGKGVVQERLEENGNLAGLSSEA